ncbi:hypothetical protein BST83_02040 [Polaribacter filamentus]|uniref:Uncharacterized protein n=1 Tax=Polaribacter filamentus TaxID=53483 RepID=A0A2S7L213_9FLAO|nr:hypothetical protein [Polaribacter filamentus]PQB08763.1 hypothetical protein BST83_02040 [Polaribacter filamentus]
MFEIGYDIAFGMIGKTRKKSKSLFDRNRNGQAYAWSRTRMGGWAVAQSPILKLQLPFLYLKEKVTNPW